MEHKMAFSKVVFSHRKEKAKSLKIWWSGLTVFTIITYSASVLASFDYML